MRNWKRIAASFLAAAMMVSSTMTVAYAEETPKNGWVYNEEENVWNLYRNDKMMVSSLCIEKNNVYYLGADGDMAAGEILHLYHKADDDGSLGNVFEVYYDANENGIPKYVNKRGEERVVPEDQWGDITTIYAKPDGRLSKNNWIVLNNGKVAFNEDDEDSAWYYFGDNENTGNVWGNGINETKIFNAYEYEMVVDKEFKEGKKNYRMDEDGKMLRGEWYKGKEEGTILEEDYRYYSYFGNMVQGYTDKEGQKRCEFRYLDGEWFAFKKDGTPLNVIFIDGSSFEETGEMSAFHNYDISLNDSNAHSELRRLATVDDVVYTGSNAEPVYEIVDENTWKKIKTGEAEDKWMSLIFDVDLASPANASLKPKLDAKFHDIYVKCDLSDNDYPEMLTGNVKAKLGEIDEENSTIEVKFAAGSTGTTNLTLHVDDFEETVAIHSVLPTNKAAATKSAKTILGSAFGSAGSGLEVKNVNGLKTLIEENEVIADTLMKSMVGLSDNVSALEASYSMVMGVTTENETSDEATEALGGKGVSTVGLALNMESDGVAEFHVDVADAMGMDEEYENVAAFDYSVTLGEVPKTEFYMPFVITTPIPKGMDGDDVVVYHSHNGADPKPIENVIVNESEGTLSFVVNQLSTFIFAEGEKGTDNDTENDGESDSDPIPTPDNDEPQYTSVKTKKSKTPTTSVKETTPAGEWIMNENGWWFKFEDGSYPANEWRKLTYNGKTDWYRFNADGYMATGWFTAADGNIYYLNPLSNGLQGAMLTGWQFIDGFWYYFNPVDDAIQGAMYRNTTTPDGYQVGADGRWIP